jgi:hypothetical protein
MLVNTNVRKKGRPPFLSAIAAQVWQEAFPEKSYRQRCDTQKCADVWKILFRAAREECSVATMDRNSKICRPKTFKRFPWLMGDRIQHVVCSELYGMSPEQTVCTADFIEKQHREKGINANDARKIARELRYLKDVRWR